LAEYMPELPSDPCGETCPGAGHAEQPWFSYEYLPPANIAQFCVVVGCSLSYAEVDLMYSIFAENMENGENFWGFFASF